MRTSSSHARQRQAVTRARGGDRRTQGLRSPQVARERIAADELRVRRPSGRIRSTPPHGPSAQQKRHHQCQSALHLSLSPSLQVAFEPRSLLSVYNSSKTSQYRFRCRFCTHASPFTPEWDVIAHSMGGLDVTVGRFVYPMAARDLWGSETPGNSVAAAQWEVRGHVEDPAIRRKPSRPILVLGGSKQSCSTSSLARRRTPPQVGRATGSRIHLTCYCNPC